MLLGHYKPLKYYYVTPFLAQQAIIIVFYCLIILCLSLALHGWLTKLEWKRYDIHIIRLKV